MKINEAKYGYVLGMYLNAIVSIGYSQQMEIRESRTRSFIKLLYRVNFVISRYRSKAIKASVKFEDPVNIKDITDLILSRSQLFLLSERIWKVEVGKPTIPVNASETASDIKILLDLPIPLFVDDDVIKMYRAVTLARAATMAKRINTAP